MEVKKLSVVDLEDKKLTNYLMGLVIVIAAFYATLEFGNREVVERVYDNFAEIFDDDADDGAAVAASAASRNKINIR